MTDAGRTSPGAPHISAPHSHAPANYAPANYAPPTAAHAYPPAQRFPIRGVRCLRCRTVQPPVPPGHFTCVSCGAVLPLQRWIAHPPAGTAGPARRSPRPPSRPYAGPPSYRFGHPRWGFPPVVWRGAPAEADPAGPDPSPRLRRASWWAVATAAAAVLAAAAEAWRFVLMLDGRTQVLSGPLVATDDALVAATGVAVVMLAVLTAAVAVPALIRTHRWSAVRSGHGPSRTARAVAARLLVPGWNVYGAGQIFIEIDAMLRRAAANPSAANPSAANPSAANPPTARPLILLWWISWIVNAALVALVLGRGLGGSLQAIADTVELHIALDLCAAVVAALGAQVLRRFARLVTGPKPSPSRWVVQPPAPTRPLLPAPTG